MKHFLFKNKKNPWGTPRTVDLKVGVQNVLTEDRQKYEFVFHSLLSAETNAKEISGNILPQCGIRQGME